jgi:hypothetical protein
VAGSFRRRFMREFKLDLALDRARLLRFQFRFGTGHFGLVAS